jgi:hypothetical protein
MRKTTLLNPGPLQNVRLAASLQKSREAKRGACRLGRGSIFVDKIDGGSILSLRQKQRKNTDFT